MSNIPTLYMMVGLPASGKSTEAARMQNENRELSIHSSDSIRHELYGSEEIYGDPNKVFHVLHSRVKNDLNQGKSVCIDSTNISKKYRIHFLNSLNNISCKKICVCMMTSYEMCITNNIKRKNIGLRDVPENVICRMYTNWTPPHESEGFDRICYKFLKHPQINFVEKFSLMDNFDQMNKHHSLSLGCHCKSTCGYVMQAQPNDNNLIIASLLHDVGKLKSASFKDKKGNIDSNCHYYQHHCIGAYDSVFYTKSLCLSDFDISDISNLIYYHMHPYNEWKYSSRCRRRHLNLLGEEFVSRVMLLHEADKTAH